MCLRQSRATSTFPRECSRVGHAGDAIGAPIALFFAARLPPVWPTQRAPRALVAQDKGLRGGQQPARLAGRSFGEGGRVQGTEERPPPDGSSVSEATRKINPAMRHGGGPLSFRACQRRKIRGWPSPAPQLLRHGVAADDQARSLGRVRLHQARCGRPPPRQARTVRARQGRALLGRHALSISTPGILQNRPGAQRRAGTGFAWAFQRPGWPSRE